MSEEKKEILYVIDFILRDRPRLLVGVGIRRNKSWRVDPENAGMLRSRSVIRDDGNTFTDFGAAIEKLHVIQSEVAKSAAIRADYADGMRGIALKHTISRDGDAYLTEVRRFDDEFKWTRK